MFSGGGSGKLIPPPDQPKEEVMLKSEDVLQKKFPVTLGAQKKVSISKIDEFLDLIVETLRYYEYPKYAPYPLVDSGEVRTRIDEITKDECPDSSGFNKKEVTRYLMAIIRTLEQYEKKEKKK